MMLGIRTYLEAGIAIVLLAAVAWFKLEADHRQTTINELTKQVAAANAAIDTQNAAVDAMRAQIDAANKARDAALAQAKKNAQSNYNRAKKLQEAIGSTCEDAQNLFLESVK